MLPAEVEPAQARPRTRIDSLALTEVAPFAQIALCRVRGGCVERWIAQGEIEHFIAAQHAVEDPRGLGLVTQFDHLPQTVGDEAPAVFAMAQQRIDQVRAGAHIQYPHCRSARDGVRRRVACG